MTYPVCMPILILLCLFFANGFTAEPRIFKHPSIVSTAEQLAGLAERINRNDLAKKAFEQLKQSSFADLERPHTPYATVVVIAKKQNAMEKAFRGDAHAAHALSLMWVITDDLRYRNKAMVILDDWAATYTGITVEKGGHSQTWLEAAWAAPIWTAAADIIRYHENGKAGWSAEKIAVFDGFLNKLIKISRRALKLNDNWGTSATLALMAVAVYQEDEATYLESLDYYRKKLKAVSLKNGALNKDYLRDPWHPQYTVLTWMQSCEIAWNQGDDIYDIKLDGQKIPRLALCLEHFSQLFLGVLPNPKGLKKGDFRDSHLKRQGYTLGYNHYLIRSQFASQIPTFVTMMKDWPPGGMDSHFMGWDTLTHGGHLNN